MEYYFGKDGMQVVGLEEVVFVQERVSYVVKE